MEDADNRARSARGCSAGGKGRTDRVAPPGRGRSGEEGFGLGRKGTWAEAEAAGPRGKEVFFFKINANNFK